MYNPEECTNEGECSGTCPKCEAELADLQRQLDARGIKDVELLDMTIKGSEMDPKEFTEISPLIVDYLQKQNERCTPSIEQGFI